jgi:hypothetical protein
MGAKDATQEADKAGAFVRTDATFRDHISKGGKYEPEGACALSAHVSAARMTSPLNAQGQATAAPIA